MTIRNRKQLGRSWLASGLALVSYLVIVALPLGGVLGAASAHAEEQSEASKQKTRRVPTLSESVYKKLAEAQEAIDAKDFNTALNVINNALQRRKNLNGNEIAQLQNMMGFIYFSKEDYPRAISAYKDVVAQGDKIPEGLEVTTLYTLAQLSFVAERYQDALRYMETWLSKANNPGPDPHIFMGQVYYQMKNYPKSIVQIERGIQVAKERGTPVKEQWWALLNFLHYERENWPKVLEILEILVKQFPKRDYWVRLAGIHGQEGNEKQQLWSMESAYVAGYLDRETDITNLSGLLMQAEVPYRAAKILDKGIKDGLVEKNSKNLRSLGQAWQLSQEVDKAIPVFESAAKLADDGKIYERLANLYLDADQNKQCVSAADSAVSKGGLRKVQVVQLIKGMCLYNQDKLSTARKSFASCRNRARDKKDDTNQRVCAQWITFIDNELNRREQLAKAI
ncbi:MAG: tetratricopeptide repeat protein [Pseudomonadales bacterium]